jgi:hypothetical protein
MSELDCEHVHWHVQGDNTIGFASCDDCNKEISLAKLFDNQRKRVDELIEKLEKLHGN